MQTKLILSILLLIGLCAAEINYSVESRNLTQRPDTGSNDQEFAQNLVRAIQNSASVPGAYCYAENPTFPLTNRSLCGAPTDKNIGWIFTFNFADAERALYQIQFGTDFGYGAAVYVDGVLQQVRRDDMWWANNWNSGAVLNLVYEFTPGDHQVIVYGGEQCCDGDFNVRFQRNSAGFQDFNVQNLQNTIPVPNDPMDDGFFEPVENIYVEAETRYSDAALTGEGEAFGAKLVGQFNNGIEDPGYCIEQNPDFPLNNKEMCQSAVERDIVWRIIWNFYVPYQSNWSFNYGTDFGRGYSLYLNGVYQQSTNADLWWAGNWDSSAVITQQLSFQEGWQQIVLYGSEGCCDGLQNVRFSVDGGEWFEANQANLGSIANMTRHNGQPFNQSINQNRIIIESRKNSKNVPGNGEEFARNLILAFEEAIPGSEGYCEFQDGWTYPFTNVEQCGAERDIAWRYVINFIVSTPGQYIFQFGLDFGKGVVGYLDNEVQFLTNQNIWWDGNWDSPAIQQITADLDAGVHQIVVYGAENCCDGAQSIRFSAKGSSWYTLTVPHLEIAGNDVGEVTGEPFYEPSQEIYVEVESRLGNRAVTGSNLQEFTSHLIGQFNSAQDDVGYCAVRNPEWPIENTTICENGSNEDIVWRWILNFYAPYSALFDFQFGVDFGRGFVAYIDGQHSLSRSTDLWWSSNWNSRDVMTLDAQLAKGWYQIVIYGSEGCCDGNQAVRFRMNGGEWYSATEENFQYIASLKAPHDGTPYSNELQGNQVIIESREGTGAAISAQGNEYFRELINVFENADPETEGYCQFETVSYPFNNAGVCGADGNIAWRWIFNFAVLGNSLWEFQFGVDSTYGLAVFLDGNPVILNNGNLWWAEDWDSLDVQGFQQGLNAGIHQVVVYGYEECCDGVQDVRVRVNRGDWFDATVLDFNNYGMFMGGGDQEEHQHEEHDHSETVELPVGEPNANVFYSPCNDILANIESRFADSTVEGADQQFGENLAIQFETAGSFSGKYCSTADPQYPINNQSLCVLGVPENITWRFVYNFYVPYDATWTWEFGVDFGRGFALFINGVYAQSTSEDLWWSGNWQSPAVQTFSANYERGWYQIVVYGSEGCCDGNQDVRLKINNGQWVQATLENLRLIAQTQETGIPYHIRHDGTYVKIETRFGDEDYSDANISDDDFARALITQFDTADTDVDGYCVYPENFRYPLKNERYCGPEGNPGSAQNIIWRVIINFEADVDSSYEFRVGPDFGRGVVVYVDGVLTYLNRSDLWWARDWDSSAVFTFGGDLQFEGNTFHQVVLYGSEGCCDGKQVFQFRVNGGEWVNVTAKNLENYSCEYTEHHAVVIETKYSEAVIEAESPAEFGSSLETLFEESPEGGEGYCSAVDFTNYPFVNAAVCGAAENIATKFVAKFHSSHNATWQFRFGSDFTKGAAVFIDSEFQDAYQSLEWDQDWDSQSVFTVEKALSIGEHTIRVYGLEGCCDGQFAAQFSYKNSGWQALTVANLQRAEEAIQCITIYSECDFEGESREVCNDIADLEDFSVRSIYVPKRRSATLYNAKYWHGCTVRVDQSLACIDQLDYQADEGHPEHQDHVIQLVEMPEHKRKKSHLRKN